MEDEDQPNLWMELTSGYVHLLCIFIILYMNMYQLFFSVIVIILVIRFIIFS